MIIIRRPIRTLYRLTVALLYCQLAYSTTITIDETKTNWDTTITGLKNVTTGRLELCEGTAPLAAQRCFDVLGAGGPSDYLDFDSSPGDPNVLLISFYSDNAFEPSETAPPADVDLTKVPAGTNIWHVAEMDVNGVEKITYAPTNVSQPGYAMDGQGNLISYTIGSDCTPIPACSSGTEVPEPTTFALVSTLVFTWAILGGRIKTIPRHDLALAAVCAHFESKRSSRIAPPQSLLAGR